MSSYWVVAPYDSTHPDLFDTAWAYDLERHCIALGWKELGDISTLSREELERKYREVYPGKPKGFVTREVNTLCALYHEISPGDVLIARRGRKKILAIGRVTGPVEYSESRGRERLQGKTEDYYSHFLPVTWEEKAIDFDRQVFSFYTIYSISEAKYQELLSTSVATAPGIDSEESIPQDEEMEFVLEKYLEEFIVSNFDSIFRGQLQLFSDPKEDINGQQYPLQDESGKIIGHIDILCQDASTGDYVIIELKKGRPPDAVVGQTLRYMGWAQKNLCDSGQGVKGLIICREVDDRLRYAVSAVSDRINVECYRIDFHLVGVSPI